jgi:hypothetical protein
MAFILPFWPIEPKFRALNPRTSEFFPVWQSFHGSSEMQQPFGIVFPQLLKRSQTETHSVATTAARPIAQIQPCHRAIAMQGLSQERFKAASL